METIDKQKDFSELFKYLGLDEEGKSKKFVSSLDNTIKHNYPIAGESVFNRSMAQDITREELRRMGESLKKEMGIYRNELERGIGSYSSTYTSRVNQLYQRDNINNYVGKVFAEVEEMYKGEVDLILNGVSLYGHNISIDFGIRYNGNSGMFRKQIYCGGTMSEIKAEVIKQVGMHKKNQVFKTEYDNDLYDSWDYDEWGG